MDITLYCKIWHILFTVFPFNYISPSNIYCEFQTSKVKNLPDLRKFMFSKKAKNMTTSSFSSHFQLFVFFSLLRKVELYSNVISEKKWTEKSTIFVNEFRFDERQSKYLIFKKRQAHISAFENQINLESFSATVHFTASQLNQFVLSIFHTTHIK